MSREDQLKKASGSVKASSGLSVFMYVLVKNYLTPSKVEELMDQVRKHMKAESITFTNGWLGKYAENLATEIIGSSNVESCVIEQPVEQVEQGPDEIIKEASALLREIEHTMSREDFERLKQEAKEFEQDCELDKIFEDIVIKEDQNERKG